MKNRENRLKVAFQMSDNHGYPALLVDWLTPVYDLFASLFIPEKRLKRDLIAHAHIAPSQQVLDLGAGTGTLAIMIKQIQPEAQVTGVDRDPNILSIASKKARRAGVEVVFEPGNASVLPYSDGTFDRVLSTLVLSLLTRTEKSIAIQEAYRVLKHGGELHIADFSRPRTRWGQMVAPLVRRFAPISANLDGLLPDFFRDAGFINIAEVSHYATLFGTISILSGYKQ
jgi:ubiquinone/menaquinone biosynthesis C-methylase UbiE